MAKYNKGKDGFYRARIQYAGKTIDLRALDDKELDEKIRQRKNEIDKGQTATSKNTTVKAWAEEWLTTYKKPFVTAKGYGTYSSIVYGHIIPEIGNVKIKDVRAVQLQKILTKRAGKSTSHVSRVKITLRALFKQARINGLLYSDPTEGLIMPQTVSGSRRVITDDERDKMFRACDEFPQKAYIYLMYYCGLRPQEAVALDWGDIDFTAKLVHIYKAVENGTGRKIKSTKTKSGVRDIPMPNDLVLKLEPLKREPGDPVVITEKGLRGDANAYERWWKKYRALYESVNGEPLPSDVTPYCLRHTYCTNLQRADVPLNVAKYLMGHADIKMTANVYGHQTDDQTETAREKINVFHSSKDTKNGSKDGSKK